MMAKVGNDYKTQYNLKYNLFYCINNHLRRVFFFRDGNVFDSRKRMKAATQDGLEHKLNSRQRSAITYNQAILAIYSNQVKFYTTASHWIPKFALIWVR